MSTFFLTSLWIHQLRLAGLSGPEVRRAYEYHLMNFSPEACIRLVELERKGDTPDVNVSRKSA